MQGGGQRRAPSWAAGAAERATGRAILAATPYRCRDRHAAEHRRVGAPGAEAAGISPHAHTDLARHRRHRPLAAPRPRRIETALGRSLHGDGCEAAAIALALVSAKPAGHFTSSPGGYFYGMVAKAKASELNLTRTIWGFRTGSRHEGKERIYCGGRDPAASP